LINLFSATEVNMFHYFLCNRESLSWSYRPQLHLKSHYLP
jgi:hypothetical protein